MQFSRRALCYHVQTLGWSPSKHIPQHIPSITHTPNQQHTKAVVLLSILRNDRLKKKNLTVAFGPSTTFITVKFPLVVQGSICFLGKCHGPHRELVPRVFSVCQHLECIDSAFTLSLSYQEQGCCKRQQQQADIDVLFWVGVGHCSVIPGVQ